MAVWTQSSDDDPLFRVQGRPVYVTELLLIVYTVFFIAEALSGTFAGGGWLGSLPLSTAGVIDHAKVWQLLTYPLINPVTPWFALQMLGLFWFGREVERAIGRRSFLFLYGGLVLIPALVLVAGSLLGGTSVAYAGSGAIHLALFVAFAFLFPDAELYFGGILARWVALVLVALESLLCVYYRQWPGLAVLWTGVGVAAVGIRSPLGRLAEWIDERREERQRARRQQQAEEKRLVEEKRNQSIDPILDKISREGLQSLTRDERERLERARLDLLQRDGK